ncbi:metallophosphoesterase [Candidatus Saccharibacteria bacterium]|nr:metallophosphoesterase [Candidatus Saccharibacteria bacterium]
MDRTFTDSFYWVKADKRAKLLVLTDLHFNENVSMGILFKIILEVEFNFCDYILIAGDLIDDNSYLDDKKNYEVLKWFLKELSRTTPVIMVLGECDTKWTKKPHAFESEPLVRMIDELENVYLLDGRFFEDKKIRIFGVSPTDEPTELYDALMSKDNTKKTTILLVHSNEAIRDQRYRRELERRFDLVISGHEHNWRLPDWLFRIALKIRGFEPNYQGNLWSIVCRPLTVFPNHPLFQKLFRRGYTIVMLSK